MSPASATGLLKSFTPIPNTLPSEIPNRNRRASDSEESFKLPPSCSNVQSNSPPSLLNRCFDVIARHIPTDDNYPRADNAVLLVKILNALPTQKIALLDVRWLEYLSTDIIIRLKEDFWNGLQLHQWRAFSPDSMRAIDPEILKKLDKKQVNSWSFDQIRSLTGAQLSDELLSKFDYYSVGALSPEQIQGFSLNQIGIIFNIIEGSEGGGDPQMTWYLCSLSDAQFHGLNQDQLQRLSLSVLRIVRQRLNETQRTNLLSNGQRTFLASIENLSNYVRSISPQVISRQFRDLPPEAMPLLSREQIAAIVPSAIVQRGGDFWTRVRRETGEAGLAYFVGSLTRTQANYLFNGDSRPPLREASRFVQYLSPEAFSAEVTWNDVNEDLLEFPIERLTLEQVRSQHRRGIVVYGRDLIMTRLTPRQIPELVPDIFRDMDTVTAVRIPDASMQNITHAQLQEMFISEDERFGGLRLEMTVNNGNFLSRLRPEQRGWLPSRYFIYLSAANIRPELMTDEQVRELNSFNVTRMIPDEFIKFRPAQIANLDKISFDYLTPAHLSLLSEQQINSITDGQLQRVPVETFRGMRLNEVTRWCRTFTERQWQAMTPRQRAFFLDLINGVPIERAGMTFGNTPPPGGGAAGGSGSGSSGGPGGGTGGGSTRSQTDYDWMWGGPQRPSFQSMFRHAEQMSEKNVITSFFPLESIRKSTAKDWEPKYTPYSNALSADDSTYTVSGSVGFGMKVLEEDQKKYKKVVQGLMPDQLRAIPDAVIPLINPLFFGCLSRKQLMQMRPEQRRAITAKFIKVEERLKTILNITKDRIVTPTEYQALLDQADRKKIKDALTLKTIQKLGNDPKSFLLYYLKSEHLFNYGANDWSRNQIAALPKEVIVNVWTAEHFNRLTPDQWLGIPVAYFSEIAPEVIAKWNKNCFEPPSVLENNNEYQQGYRERIQALGNKVRFIAPEVITKLGLKVFVEAMTPNPLDGNSDQFAKLTREQRQAISFKIFPSYFFMRLWERYTYSKQYEIEDLKRIVGDFTEKQIKDIIDIFLPEIRTKGELAQIFNFFQPWQIAHLPQALLDTIPFYTFAIFKDTFLNSLDVKQLRTRTPQQISNINPEMISGLKSGFIKNLTVSQTRELITSRDNIVVRFGNNIEFFAPDVFHNQEVVTKIFLDATGDQLRLLKQNQIRNVDLTEISPPAFGKACEKGEVAFLKMFNPKQINSLNSAQLKAISINIYKKLFVEIHTKMTDQQIRLYAANLSPTEYRVATRTWIEALEAGEWTPTDQQRREILNGTLRLKIYRDAPEQTTPPTIVIVSGQRVWEGLENDQLETQIPAPPVPRVDTRISGRVAELRA